MRLGREMLWIEATAIVSHEEIEPAIASRQAHLDMARVGMACGVGDRFTNNHKDFILHRGI